ncbi:MAG: hypothetical protein K0B08_05010 [Bacteroidales bacterium]|nr:hypothetical protein [Bacteroidales bacterium]
MKHQESIILENFRKHFHGFPKGRIIKSESPDFILKCGQKHAIGIELTRLEHSEYIINPASFASFIEHLHAAIRNKSEKLSNYRKNNLNAYWLIIHADSIVHKIPEFTERLRDSIPASGFDRVFLFALFEGEVWELHDSVWE